MESQLSLSIIEIIVLMLGAVLVGVTIHFIITSRRSLKASTPAAHQQISKQLSEWKLKYFNEIESRDKELTELRKKLADSEDNNHIFSIEAEETRKENKALLARLATGTPGASSPGKSQSSDQLAEAQTILKDYQEKIGRVLDQINIVRDAEHQQRELQKNNEALSRELEELKVRLAEQEGEISNVRHKQVLTTEMSSIIDSAYNEFNILQDKMHKLEGQVGKSRKINLEYEDLKQEHQKVLEDLTHLRHKYISVSEDRDQLNESLVETEDKLREANFQRQQLQKKVAYLEDMNMDMQAVSDANKKLEYQIKRIGELESMLHMMAEEKEERARKQSL